MSRNKKTFSNGTGARSKDRPVLVLGKQRCRGRNAGVGAKPAGSESVHHDCRSFHLTHFSKKERQKTRKDAW